MRLHLKLSCLFQVLTRHYQVILKVSWCHCKFETADNSALTSFRSYKRVSPTSPSTSIHRHGYEWRWPCVGSRWSVNVTFHLFSGYFICLFTKEERTAGGVSGPFLCLPPLICFLNLGESSVSSRLLLMTVQSWWSLHAGFVSTPVACIVLKHVASSL